MTVNAMREHVVGMYHSDRWRLRVLGMPDRQVIAIYKNMQRRGQKPKKEPKDNKTQQITIFDLLEESQNG